MSKRFMRIPTTTLLLCGLGFLVSTTSAQDLPEEPPSGGEVIRRLIERIEEREPKLETGSLVWERHLTVEELTKNGRIKETEKKVWQVHQSGNGKSLQLILLNGKDPTEEEVREESRDFSGDSSDDSERRSRRSSGRWINTELLERFLFNNKGLEEVEGIACWRLDIQPSGLHEAENMKDRVMDHMNGSLWVSKDNHELVKADVSLSEKVYFWGGVLGSLQALDISLLRMPAAPGFWLDRETQIYVKGHYPFNSFHYRHREESRNLKFRDNVQTAEMQKLVE